MLDKKDPKIFILRWWKFIIERFPPLSHGILIVFVFAANALVAFKSSSIKAVLGKNEILGWIAILLVFFHLRVFDEIKDYDTDKLAHPERPLVRGLISIKEAKGVAVFLVLLEFILGALIGLPAFLGISCTILYSLLMYKEFFIKEWLRGRLVTYALTHSIISGIIPLFVFSCVTSRYFWQIPIEYRMFVFVNLMLSNIFEFSRKTFAKDEEKDFVDSYSKNLGTLGTALIVLLMVTLSVCVAFALGISFHLNFLFFILMGLLFLLIVFTSLFYAYFKNVLWAKTYRGAGSLFILLYNIIITGGLLWNL